MVDKLLEKNGDNKHRLMYKTWKQQLKKEVSRLATLTLLYKNDKDANCIRNFIKSNKIPVRPVFTPGKTLAQTFCRSRPFDQKECVKSNPGICDCEVCLLMVRGRGCSKRGVVYEIVCNLCSVKYQREADRPLNNSIIEHIRAAKNP